MKQTKILAINSFAVHGMASLKTIISILGSKVLPVPSVVLNGLTNMPHVQKHLLPFRELLEGTFKLVAERKQQVILYVGYLGSPDQVDVILDMIRHYRSHIRLIITDPICGDHGRAYVSTEIISRWPDLIALSDYTFPNVTELKLMSGQLASADLDPKIYVQEFEKLFPHTSLIVTSYNVTDDKISILLSQRAKVFEYNHALIAKNYSGTGDAFLAYFILFHFYEALSIEVALQRASEKVVEKISMSIQQEEDELII